MIRVLVCDSDAVRRTRMRGALARYAVENGIGDLGVGLVHTPEALRDAVCSAHKGFFSMVVCNVQDEGALQCLSDVRVADRDLHLVLLSQAEEDALHAFALDAGFFLDPGDYAGFCETVGAPLSARSALRRRTFAVKSLKSVVNIALEDITFVESAKKGPIIHLTDGSDVVTRGTLQSLYERLVKADAERFLKAGGSFIVNLDNIRSAGESSVVFATGDTIIVPVRTRKTLKDALAAYRAA